MRLQNKKGVKNMKLKLDELVDMFDEIQNYEYIVYDKKENDFIFIDLNMM